jgi:hypothetical protein
MYGKNCVHADEELKHKTKVMSLLQKMEVLPHLDREGGIFAVVHHCAVNESTVQPFNRKKDK